MTGVEKAEWEGEKVKKFSQFSYQEMGERSEEVSYEKNSKFMAQKPPHLQSSPLLLASSSRAFPVFENLHLHFLQLYLFVVAISVVIKTLVFLSRFAPFYLSHFWSAYTLLLN